MISLHESALLLAPSNRFKAKKHRNEICSTAWRSQKMTTNIVDCSWPFLRLVNHAQRCLSWIYVSGDEGRDRKWLSTGRRRLTWWVFQFDRSTNMSVENVHHFFFLFNMMKTNLIVIVTRRLLNERKMSDMNVRDCLHSSTFLSVNESLKKKRETIELKHHRCSHVHSFNDDHFHSIVDPINNLRVVFLCLSLSLKYSSR